MRSRAVLGSDCHDQRNLTLLMFTTHDAVRRPEDALTGCVRRRMTCTLAKNQKRESIGRAI
ncbi:MAG TPA: hypothetical protein VG297_19370 [Bryobacteraceae bacterium]|nr:hypothetical protein [Bryobacteraceae bacterium]